jgi:hypothetical protein
VADRIFLLSPASCSGKRARLVFNPEAGFDVARRLRSPEGAPVGDVFTFLSGLYFRGKLAYARRYARPPEGTPGVLIITAGAGLVEAEDRSRPPPGAAARARSTPASSAGGRLDRRRAQPVFAHAGRPARLDPAEYVDIRRSLRGPASLPADFVGRGDEPRGLLLGRARGHELEYRPSSAVRRAIARRKP